MDAIFKDATSAEINATMDAALACFETYRKTPPDKKALFLDTIADQIEQLGDQLIFAASEETNLPAARLLGERGRTTSQLRSFAEMLREGSWVEASIDTAQPGRKPIPKPDLRKMLIPIGPVVVFGASNFPFAYSTAGGDTASALAAGCPVVVKAHQAHAKTSEMVFQAIKKAIKICGMPETTFQHIHGASVETGKMLVQHPATAAVGFTGSFRGGKALYDYAHERKVPIPVFSEMGSVNPVIFFPQTLKKNAEELARSFAQSVTNGMGQFCTKPGLMFAIDDEGCDHFLSLLLNHVREVKPAKMLHQGIYESYVNSTAKLSRMPALAYEAVTAEEKETALPAIASVSGDDFLQNPALHEEVFGPYSLMIRCKDKQQMKEAWLAVAGQLTTSLVGTNEELAEYQDMVEAAVRVAGRIVFNGVPTGVEVCPSMVHGGPYPATTDSRFTAVGLPAVKRWVRPVCFQQCPDNLLPAELRNENPLHIWRLVNNNWTKDAIN